MSSRSLHSLRGWPLFALGAAGFAVLLLIPGRALPRAAADGNGTVIRVEEDWTLVLNEPGTLTNAPQFHTVMSPYWNLEGVYGQVLWNYREDPDYAPGGLKLAGWDGEDQLDTLDVGEDPLSNSAETITWTQRLSTDGSRLTFQVLNGHSTTWGDFGGDRMTTLIPAAVAHLDHYSPMVSKAGSGVSYGANRVNLLVITERRRYSANGLVSRHTNPIVVFQGVSGSQD